MEKEIKRRMKILDNKKVSKITQAQLRGGMQSRLNRQESIRYGNNINKQKKKLKNKLSLIEKERSEDKADIFGMSSISEARELEDFSEPVFRKIRSKRGFFNE